MTGLIMQVSDPDVIILAKRKRTKLCGGSEKQLTDALQVCEVQYGKLDIDYLEQWTKKLDVESLWKRLKDEAEKYTRG